MLEPDIRVIGSQESLDPQARILAALNGHGMEQSPLPSKRTLDNSNLPIMRTEKRAVVHHQTQTQRFSIEPISWYEEVSFQVQTHESLSRYTILCPGRIPSGFRMHEKVLGGISMVETVSSSLGRPGIRGRFLMNTKFDCVRKAREARVVCSIMYFLSWQRTTFSTAKTISIWLIPAGEDRLTERWLSS